MRRVQRKMQTAFKIYTKPECPYCDEAKIILVGLQVPVMEFDASFEDNRKRIKDMGFNTVPQIWFGEEHIGGCDSLKKWLEVDSNKEKLNG